MKYSARDIHRMREALDHQLDVETGWVMRGSSRSLTIESRLVTYMANGTTPLELEADVLLEGRRRFGPDWLPYGQVAGR